MNAVKFIQNNTFLLLILFAQILVFCYWRSDFNYVWDDSNLIKQSLLVTDSFWTSHARVLINCFSSITDRGYRPISNFIQNFYILSISAISPEIFIKLTSGLLIGIFNIYVFYLLKFLNYKKYEILAIILTINLTPIFLQANWILIAGYPILIPLIFVASIYHFLNYINSSRKIHLFFFIFFIIFGSFYREFVFIVPLVLLIYYLINAQRKNFFNIFILLILFFATVFPTVLPKMFFLIFEPLLYVYDHDTYLNFNSLEIMSIFQMGSASDQLANNVITFDKLKQIFNINAHFILIVPILWLTLFSTFLTLDFFQKKFYNFSKNEKFLNCIFVIFLIFFNIFAILLTPVFGFLIIFVLCLISLQNKSYILLLWFLLSYIPILFVFTEKIHLIYGLIPFVIIFIPIFLEKIKKYFHINIFYKILIISFCGFGLIDLMYSPKFVRDVMAESANANVMINNYIQENSLEDGLFIVNGISLDDLMMLNAYNLYFTHRAGHISPKVIEDTITLKSFLESNINNTDIYHLEVHFDYMHHKKFFHRHKFVSACSNEYSYKNNIYSIKKILPLFDFPKYFIDRQFWNYVGPPDLQDDYYYGPASTFPFYEFSALYNLYKIKSSKTDLWIPDREMTLIKKFKDYYILKNNGKFFATKNFNNDYRELCMSEDIVASDESIKELENSLY
jgi:hypothetical protein